MNRKNLTAAVLAALAGAAGIAGTAQAVNINPDGTGQVLLFPYYTANDGNQTLLTVVNTTEQAKALKVRFMEGFNSREVLDFNLYMSHHDVWVAAVVDFGASTGMSGAQPYLMIPDNSCTVPYLYPQGGHQFLDLAYTDNSDVGGPDLTDGGPTSLTRAAEGHFEVIEMGTLVGEAALAATHNVDGVPHDCQLLTDRWTESNGPEGNGIWFDEAQDDEQASTDTLRNSGGVFGTAAIVNSENGTMYSYDAQAIQGFDSTADGIHYIPGTIHPSLNDGNEDTSYVFFGVPQNTVVELEYDETIDAVSSVFMHEHLMNEYVVLDDLDAGTEWIVTFPTKNFYADQLRLEIEGLDEEFCTGEGDDEVCVDLARDPFTKLFGAEQAGGTPDCEVVSIKTWDRDEQTYNPDAPPTGTRPPVVSPSLPECDPVLDPECRPDETPFQLCNEVNVLRFGESVVFGTPSFAEGSLLLSVDDEFEAGWGRINFGGRTDEEGLVGLPVTGFAAEEYENDFAEGGDVKAFYGGLFRHKYNVRRVNRDPR